MTTQPELSTTCRETPYQHEKLIEQMQHVAKINPALEIEIDSCRKTVRVNKLIMNDHILIDRVTVYESYRRNTDGQWWSSFVPGLFG